MAILDFLVSGLTLVWLWISTPNGIWVRAYWFSVTSFYKWLPGGHIRFFGFWMAWFRQRNSSLLWNFSFKFHVHVLCGCSQKPNDCQIYRFVMAALWFWTMFNCNPPSAHCHPLLWGGGILVDHWSTISSSTCFDIKNVLWHEITLALCVRKVDNWCCIIVLTRGDWNILLTLAYIYLNGDFLCE